VLAGVPRRWLPVPTEERASVSRGRSERTRWRMEARSSSLNSSRSSCFSKRSISGEFGELAVELAETGTSRSSSKTRWYSAAIRRSSWR